MIPFSFNENRYFFVADHLLVGQLCTNPKSDRSFLSCLKVTQCSTSKIGDALLYNSCSLPIQVMTTGPLPVPSKCKSGLPRITGTCPGWWKRSFRLQLWSLVWFQVRATSCHLTSSKTAWKSTPKCTWMCWRVWWSPGAIRWPVADPGCGSRTRRRPTSPKRPRLGFRRSATTLYPSLTVISRSVTHTPSPVKIYSSFCVLAFFFHCGSVSDSYIRSEPAEKAQREWDCQAKCMGYGRNSCNANTEKVSGNFEEDPLKFTLMQTRENWIIVINDFLIIFSGHIYRATSRYR